MEDSLKKIKINSLGKWNDNIIKQKINKPTTVIENRKLPSENFISKLEMKKNNDQKVVEFDFSNSLEHFKNNIVFTKHSSDKIDDYYGMEDFLFDRLSEIKFRYSVNKKKKYFFIFQQITKDILEYDNIKDEAVNIFSKYNADVGIFRMLIDFLKDDDVIDNKKLRFSIVNFVSKSIEINNIKNADVTLSIDAISNSIVLNIVKKPILRNYLVNLNLKFKPNGSVSFICYDSDDKDKSYIKGSVSRYDTYMSSLKFKSIIDMINLGV